MFILNFNLPPYSCKLVQVFIHLRSLIVSYFGMVAATVLKLWCLGHIQRHDLHIECPKFLPVGSEVDRGGHTDTNRTVTSLAYIITLGRKWTKMLCGRTMISALPILIRTETATVQIGAMRFKRVL
jgi:hypothetical protein